MDPLAQSFYISRQTYPNGMFLTAVDLFVKSKPVDPIPLVVEIREMENGFPSAYEAMPFSQVSVAHADVKVPSNTESLDSIVASPTHVKFPVPVYLEPGKEYALVVKSNSSDYYLYISEMGEKNLGTDVVVRQQPLMGSLFKSQNSRTWTPFQNEDLMMRLYKAVFDTNVDATVVLQNRNAFSEDVKYNLANNRLKCWLRPLPSRIDFSYEGIDAATGAVETYPLERNGNLVFPHEMLVRNVGDIKVRATFGTNDKHVSPILDQVQSSVVLVQNQINYYGLKKEGFLIIDRGTGYTTATITVSGGGGDGAIIEPVIVNGEIVDVKVVSEGANYTSQPTITVSGDGTGAQIVYVGFETDPQGGNCKARYITKPIVLESDFEATSVNVKLDANRPPGTGIDVYVKAKAATDERHLNQVPWRKLVLTEADIRYTKSDNEFIELEYVPENDTLAYTYDGTTFDSVSTILFKVVLLSTNTSVVPRVRDFRAVTVL